MGCSCGCGLRNIRPGAMRGTSGIPGLLGSGVYSLSVREKHIVYMISILRFCVCEEPASTPRGLSLVTPSKPLRQLGLGGLPMKS